MKRYEVFVLCLAVASLWVGVACAEEALRSPYAQWSRGPGAGADFFPIAVWLQSPANAGRYRDAGFNLYVGLWRGPTDEQLSQLQAAGIRVICSQNKVALSRLDDPTIVGWMLSWSVIM